jgi:butyryl-CoA dehydrogenase
MSFKPSREHTLFRESVQAFVEREILPAIAYYEEKSVFPRELFRKMGREGFLKAHVSAEVRGLGLGTMGYCIFSEEVARAGVGLTHNGHFQLGKMLLEFGTETQKERYLSHFLNGSYVAAMAITEPGVGSSFAGMQTVLRAQECEYVLDGQKSFINDAAEADVIGVLCKSDDGYSLVMLDKETPGFRILRKLDPIGGRSSPVYDFEMVGCKVSDEAVLGTLNEGLTVFFTAFNFSRLGNASAALGLGKAAFDKALQYGKKRRVGRHHVTEFQGIRWALADLSVQLEAARLLRDRAAWLVDRKGDPALEASQAKLFCVETANQVVGKCIQITGRYGCLRDNTMELYLRDARALGVMGGSLEVMRNNVARRVIDG